MEDAAALATLTATEVVPPVITKLGAFVAAAAVVPPNNEATADAIDERKFPDVWEAEAEAPAAPTALAAEEAAAAAALEAATPASVGMGISTERLVIMEALEATADTAPDAREARDAIAGDTVPPVAVHWAITELSLCKACMAMSTRSPSKPISPSLISSTISSSVEFPMLSSSSCLFVGAATELATQIADATSSTKRILSKVCDQTTPVGVDVPDQCW